MARLVMFSCAAVFIIGSVFGYLAWLEHAPEGPEAEARHLFEETMALAEAGDPAAQRALGGMYETGQGTRRELAEAATWYAAAAARRDPVASYRLGRLYEGGKGVKPDYHLAAALYERAAAAGLADGHFALAQMHLKGRGVANDLTIAIDLLHRAAGNGHPAAQYLLASMYRDGWGLKRDNVEAYKWYTLAMTQAKRAMSYDIRYDPVMARRDLAAQMSRHQIDQAEDRAARFLAAR